MRVVRSTAISCSGNGGDKRRWQCLQQATGRWDARRTSPHSTKLRSSAIFYYAGGFRMLSDEYHELEFPPASGLAPLSAG